MAVSLRVLADLVTAARMDRQLTQEDLAASVNPVTNRTAVAHFEQSRVLPNPTVLRSICEFLAIPTRYWHPFLESEVQNLIAFDTALSELVGHTVTLSHHDLHTEAVAQKAALSLFNTTDMKEQIYDRLCAVLVHYGVPRPSRGFFDQYLGTDAFISLNSFRQHVRDYQKEAIRLFSSFSEAYIVLSSADSLDSLRRPLKPRSDEPYRARTTWNVIEEIPEDRLPDLGYISAARVKKEQNEREYLAKFLQELAEKIAKNGQRAIDEYSEKKRRSIGSLLRKFNSALHHDLMSPLFIPDSDQLRREAERLAPKKPADIARMEKTQAMGLRNLSRYLTADHLDVYVATSMRSDADFASVNGFVTSLFRNDLVRPLKLRYFNPTQSWIEDRVAKGLVEALMLKRADITIYMAQKSDTFGKDSEASVALGQGKPVIVYVPRLFVPNANVDSESLGLTSRADLQRMITREAVGEDAEVDEATDDQALLAQLLTLRLSGAPAGVLPVAAAAHWADFDLYGEANRIQNDEQRAQYRAWLDRVVRDGKVEEPNAVVRQHFVGILVATATNFEKRAKIFREVHPLALQVILSTGVLNGILVVRSVEACAKLLARLVTNNLELDLTTDDKNYRLIEQITGSTIRVISHHSLLKNAFAAFYKRMTEVESSRSSG